MLQDIEWLASKLPNVKELVKVDDKYYNHASFLISKNNNVLLNNQLISFLPSPNWRWIFSTNDIIVYSYNVSRLYLLNAHRQYPAIQKTQFYLCLFAWS